MNLSNKFEGLTTLAACIIHQTFVRWTGLEPAKTTLKVLVLFPFAYHRIPKIKNKKKEQSFLTALTLIPYAFLS